MTTLPLDQRIGHYLKRAEQELISAKHAALRAYDLTVPQYTVLFVLSEEPGLSGAVLARRCLVTPQTMSSVLNTLNRRKLVERKPHPIHTHILETRLTRGGRALLRQADKAAVAIESELGESFTEEETKRFIEYLTRCSATSARIRANIAASAK
ncbi:MarR family winged helix-turn-helix transcriptional regulator [Actinorugispora endophytica]|uniref:DNA-binding MarR family transcriptional regulator n=1 Tax=Actinorugispora endophytica TaxID=1605990 RepID=A0A4R6V8F8_9ACTN|nr:MarR family transcriptional regulator [Actinorugispora endophytica]TDQ55562.1 DNA-binding MarR family transcriptional regulator [Actinorugispora endophytica]